jgi:hypothetical protein
MFLRVRLLMQPRVCIKWGGLLYAPTPHVTPCQLLMQSGRLVGVA